jgi:hypothetical protein
MNTISESYRAIEAIICKYGREASVAPVKRADLPSREEINAAVKRGLISMPEPVGRGKYNVEPSSDPTPRQACFAEAVKRLSGGKKWIPVNDLADSFPGMTMAAIRSLTMRCSYGGLLERKVEYQKSYVR